MMSTPTTPVPASTQLSLAAFSLLRTPPVDVVRLAAMVGFDRVGVRAAIMADGVDHGLLGNSGPRRELKRALEDTGTSVLDVEAVVILGGRLSVELELVLEVAADLDAHLLDVLVFDDDPDRALDAFVDLCTRARAFDVGCFVEFMGFSAVHDLGEAQRLITASGADNCGVLLDPLHLARTGGDVDDVRALPIERLPYAQLCDARHADPERDLRKAREEAVSDRLAPGEGRLPLAGFVQALPAGTPLSVEVPIPASVDPTAHAGRLYRGARQVLQAAGR